jgi:prepilin-type N-terminal cleavage/methylation domain-containing protein
MKNRLPETRAQCQGLTLIELCVAVSILGFLLLGLGGSIYSMDRANIYSHNRAVSFKAAQQVLEAVMNETIDDSLSRSAAGETFDVLGLVGLSGTDFGTVTATDLNWDGTTGSTYLFTIRVTDPNTQETYARLYTVRTR